MPPYNMATAIEGWEEFMDISLIKNLAYDILATASELELLEFWRSNPEIASVSMVREVEYDQDLGRIESCRLTGVEFVSEEARQAFLIRLVSMRRLIRLTFAFL